MSFLTPRPVATHDFYAPIHKGLRYAHSGLLVRLGQADPDDVAMVGALIADVRRQCRLSAVHLDNEEREIHVALEARAPGAAQRLEHAHEDHRQSLAEIEALTVRIEHAGDRAVAAAEWRRLYLRFSQFVADDLAHMAEEELVILPVLQSLFTDAELMAIEDAIMSTMAPPDLMADAALIAPATTRRERAAILDAFRATAPAQAFEAVMELAVRPALTPQVWRELNTDLGIEA
jgi:hypothetical protein